MQGAVRGVVQIWNRFQSLGLVRSTAPLRRNSLEEWTVTLLKWALLFFVISIVAGILGFTGISAASADVARWVSPSSEEIAAAAAPSRHRPA